MDLESELMRGPDSIPTGGNILSLDFLSHSKASDANIGIIANFVYLSKTRKHRLITADFYYLHCEAPWRNFCEFRLVSEHTSVNSDWVYVTGPPGALLFDRDQRLH